VKAKISQFLTVTGVVSLLIGPSHVSSAGFDALADAKSGNQVVSYEVIGNCVDEFDDSQSEFVYYEGESCFFAVTVRPAKPARVVALQYKNRDGRWVTESRATTKNNGIAFLYPETLDDDGDFYCETYDYRIGLQRLGGAKSLLSSVFSITFVANSDWCY